MQQIFLLGAVRPVTYFYTVTTVLAVVFSMISPETGLPYWQELVLWLAQTLIPLSMILGIHLLLCRFCRFNRLKTVLKLSLSAILAIVLYSPIAYFIDILFNIQAMPTDTARVPLEIIDELGGVGPPLLISWLALNLPLLLGYRFEKHPEPKRHMGELANAPSSVAATANGISSFDHPNKGSSVDFLPKDIDQLIYLKAELHYLLVMTTEGSSLELFNLKDAIASLPSDSGLSPHRSWWVNLHHIQRYKAAGRQGQLILSDGSQIPVSRRRTRQIKSLVNTKTSADPT